MTNSTSAPSTGLRTSPPSALGLPPLREPQTKWTALTVPLDTTTQEANRQKGKIVALASLPLCGATFIAFLISGTPKKVTVSLGLATVVSLVTGVSIWFFNSAADEKQLLSRRAEVGKNIQKRSLGSTRKQYRDEKIISNEELNQWMRYFLDSQAFDVFAKKQSEHISELTLDPLTKDLIRAKGLYFLRDPSCTTNLSRFGEMREVLAMGSFTAAELEDLRKLVEKARVTLRAVDDKSYGAHYNKLFYDVSISEWQRESKLKMLPKEDLPFYAWLFSIYAWESALGIDAIEEKYKLELAIFQEWFSPNANCLNPHLFHFIADLQAVAVKSSKQTDGEVSFEGFIVKNGEKAIQYITNENTKARLCQRFLAHLKKLDLGFVRAHEQFAVSFEQFGNEATKEVDKALLQYEWDNIDQRTSCSYIDIRKRTGLVNIPDIRKGNHEDVPVVQKLNQSFLELPPKDLLSPEYQEDRAMLGITDDQLRDVLIRTWTPWTLKKILELHGDAFVASLSPPNPLFTVQQWETHINAAVQGAQIEDIFEHYLALFKIGVLKASDGNFAAQIRSMQVGKLRAFLEKYGDIVFGQKLLEKTDHKVAFIVADFIHAHADYYLGDSTATVTPFADMIRDYSLIPEAIRVVIESINERKVGQGGISERILRGLEAQHKKEKAAIDQRAEEEIQRLDEDILSKQRAAKQAERDLNDKQTLLESYGRDIEDLETREARAKGTAEQLEVDLSELRSKKRELDRVSGLIQSLGNQITVAEGEWREREAELQQKAKINYYVRTAQGKLEALMRERTDVELKITAIRDQQTERDALVRKLSEPSTAVRSEKSGLEEETDVPVANAPAIDPATQDQSRLRMLNTILGYEENSLEAAEARVEFLNSQIHLKEEEKAKLVREIFDDRALKSKREEVESFQQRLGKLQGQQADLISVCESLASREAALQSKKDEWRAIELSRKGKEAEKKLIPAQISALSEAKERADAALATARKELEQNKAEVKKKQVAQNQASVGKLNEDKEDEKRRYSRELLRIVSDAKAEILQVTRSFSAK